MQEKQPPEIPEAVPQPAKRVYSRQRIHWYMAAVVVEYTEEVVIGKETKTVMRTKRMNAIVQSKERFIVARTLEDVRNMTFQRSKEQYNITPESFSDYIITNMIYMGHMSEHDHFTKLQGS